MPLIDGEKFACQSCIKGHRVSGCNHTDRELHHINPKGRPVKQCEHCRGARKSKSHHAKCDCGDKKDKDKAQPKDRADATCCCHSGSKCICGIKKESIDLRLDTTKQTLHDVRARPKVMSTHSENNLTVFANGHHRPCHRNNNSAHISGLPYKIPRPHTLHGQSAFSTYTQDNTAYNSPVDAPVPRSADTLSVSNNDFYQIFGSTSRADGLPLTPLSGSLDTPCFQEALFTGQRSTFGTGTHSPTESHVSDTIGTSQWPYNSNMASLNRNFNFGSLSTSPSQDCLTNLDDWALPSAGLVDGLPNHTWSAGDLPLDTNSFGEGLVQPVSNSGESKQSAPGLSAASSSPSEIGEPILFGDFDLRTASQSTTSETLFWDDAPAFRPAPSHVSDNRMPTSVPPRSTPETQGLEANFTKAYSPIGTTLAGSGANMYSEAPAMTMAPSFEDVAATDAWLLEQASNTAFGEFAPDLNASGFPEWI